MKITKEHKIEILAVGSEFLTAYFQDTNSLYLTQRLNDLGMEITAKTIVGDDWENLVLYIAEAFSRADVIILMGGLGPTKDDRTREAVASVLERKLIFKKSLLQKIEARFKKRGLSMPLVNKKQAYVIEGAEILENENGTAPGLWISLGTKIIILLPGPPHELKPMFESYVWPRFQAFQSDYTARRVLKIAGLTESKIETLILDIYPKMHDLRLNTLAYPGQIEIHLTGYSRKDNEDAEQKVRRLEKKILERLQENVFSTSDEELEEIVGKLLSSSGKTLAVAESCTGGFLGHRITNVPGSSDYFIHDIVVYSNKSKTRLVGVPLGLLEKHGAVSSEVARTMACGVREKAQASYGLAITGIAGPTGSSPGKPVGLVYVALSWENGDEVAGNIFLGTRETVKFQSTQKALDMLRRHMLKAETK